MRTPFSVTCSFDKLFKLKFSMPEFSIFILFNGNFSQNTTFLVQAGQSTVCFISVQEKNKSIVF